MAMRGAKCCHAHCNHNKALQGHIAKPIAVLIIASFTLTRVAPQNEGLLRANYRASDGHGLCASAPCTERDKSSQATQASLQRGLERDLLADYVVVVVKLVSGLSASNLHLVVQVASLHGEVRSFGLVKAAAVERYRSKQATLLKVLQLLL
jgi:hypothetical protein